MSNRVLASIGALVVVIAVVLVAPVPGAGQARTAAATPTTGAAEPWTPLRTPDGQPDLQGYWTNQTFTPFERPAELAGKAFFTDKEAAENFRQRVQRSPETTFSHPPETDATGAAYVGGAPVYDATTFGLDAWQQGVVMNRRTSIIVDPPDGKMPPLTPEAKQRLAARAEARKLPPAGVEDISLQVRCVWWDHEGPPITTTAYNNNLQILQIPGYVVLLTEMVHDVRFIPLDGRAHLPQNIRLIMGDSRGHWEGETLVVDTTNFTNKTQFRGSGQALHVVERFTRVDADTIRYEFTVDDPTMWTRPWSGEYLWGRIQGPIFEYACHEGNLGIENILSAARAEEKAAEEAAKKK